MNIYKVKTKFNHHMIIQESGFNNSDLRDDMVSEIIKLKDEGVRQALIKLGWTPPLNSKNMGEDSMDKDMYTRGIRKVFQPNCNNISEAINQANSCNQVAFNWNGDIYVKVPNEKSGVAVNWRRSPFDIYDFKF